MAYPLNIVNMLKLRENLLESC